MDVRTVPLDQITPYDRNPRKNGGAVGKVANSLREFGWRQPIVVDAGFVIVVGHTRWLAAKSLGMLEAPIHVASGLSADQVRAYRLADNRTNEEAEWNDELLALEIRDLDLAGYDLGVTGFDADELAKLRLNGSEGLTDSDEVPPAPETPSSVLGDVWLLGDHRLVCGDCTDVLVVGAALAGAKPRLMVTDPPYGVKYQPGWRNEAERSSGKKVGARAVGVVLNDDRSDWREAWALFPGAVAYIWHAGTYAGDVAGSMLACQIRAQIIWVKQRHVLSRGDYHHQHEPCFYGVREGDDEGWNFTPEHEVALYAVRKGETGHYVGGRKQSTVWFIEHVKSETGHGTQKPVMCMQRPIENNSLHGERVYEPFSGSGTTLLAAQITGRLCHAIELNPVYVDVAVMRWQNFTGLQATLESDGRSFNAVQAARLGSAQAA